MDEAELKTTEKSKKGPVARFKSYLFNRKGEKAVRRDIAALENENGNGHAEKVEKARKLNHYLDAIESQLDKMDEQNKILLFHLSTVKENNEALLEQVKVLSKNNEQLFQQFQTSKKREKLAKVIAIIASGLAIGFWIYQFIKIFTGNG